MNIPEHFHFYHRRMVEFADTDQAGLMHFSNFFCFVESAEHAFSARWVFACTQRRVRIIKAGPGWKCPANIFAPPASSKPCRFACISTRFRRAAWATAFGSLMTRRNSTHRSPPVPAPSSTLRWIRRLKKSGRRPFRRRSAINSNEPWPLRDRNPNRSISLTRQWLLHVLLTVCNWDSTDFFFAAAIGCT